MIRENKLMFIGAFILLAAPAWSQQKTGGPFELSGTMGPSTATGKIYLSYTNNKVSNTDSADVSNGAFKFNGQVEEPVLASLRFKPAARSGVRLSSLSFFLEPGSIKISSTDSLRTGKISGSKTDNDFLPIRDALTSYQNKVNDLNTAGMRFKNDKDTVNLNAVIKQIRKLQSDLKENTYRPYIKEHLSSPVSLYALSQVIGADLKLAEIEPLFNSLSTGVRNLNAHNPIPQGI
jgi:hypothetical protein